MAKYELYEFDGILYEAHPTKQTKTKLPIGFTLVEATNDFDKYCETNEKSLMLSDAKRGKAIRLQAMARNCCGGDKFTESDYNRIAPKLLAGNEERYFQHFELLRADAEKYYHENEAGEVPDPDHYWVEFC